MKQKLIYSGVVALVVGVTLIFAFDFFPDVLPQSCRGLLTSEIVETTDLALSMNGLSLEAAPKGWEVGDPAKGPIIELSGEIFLGSIRQIPLFCLVVLLVTLVVWRHWNFGRVGGLALTVVSWGIVFFGLPAVSGFLQGVSLDLIYSNLRMWDWSHAIVHYAASMLIGGGIALGWALARWALAAETVEQTSNDFRRMQRGCLLAAGGAAGVVAAFHALAAADFARLMLVNRFSQNEFRPWAIVSISIAVTSGVAAAFLLMGVKRGRPVRWIWVMMLLLIPLAGGAAGAFALLLAVVCDAPWPKESVPAMEPLGGFPVKTGEA